MRFLAGRLALAVLCLAPVGSALAAPAVPSSVSINLFASSYAEAFSGQVGSSLPACHRRSIVLKRIGRAGSSSYARTRSGPSGRWRILPRTAAFPHGRYFALATAKAVGQRGVCSAARSRMIRVHN